MEPYKEVILLKKIAPLICLLLIGTIASASPYSAPLNTTSSTKISQAFVQNYQSSYVRDIQGVPLTPIPTYEQAYAYAKWMNKAFDKVGYNMEETIHSYLRSERTVPVGFFMAQLGLENYLIFMHVDRISKAFVDAGVISEETAYRVSDHQRNVPIGGRADHAFEPIPGYRPSFISADVDINAFKRHPTRRVGHIRQGTSKLWDDHLYFEDIETPGELRGIAIVNSKSINEFDFETWQGLVEKRVKIEMSIFNLSGMAVISDDGKTTVTSPAVVDLGHQVLVIELEDLSD